MQTNGERTTLSNSYVSKYRYEGLWFEDGNVIFAGPKSESKVHRGILASASRVFEDMFSLPQPPGSMDRDSVPVIPVYDPETHFTLFLRAVFVHGYIESFLLEKDALLRYEALSILGLSTKYDAPYLRKCCIAYLSRFYPATLEEYFTRYEFGVAALSTFASSTTETDAGKLITVINTAHSYDVRIILPALMYDLCTLGMRYIFEGASPGPGLPTANLSHQDQMTCATAREMIVGDWRLYTIASIMDNIPSQYCEDPRHCKDILATSIWKTGAMEAFITPEVISDLTCEVYFADVKATFRDARQSIWDRLPGYFGLPEWSTLVSEAHATVEMQQ